MTTGGRCNARLCALWPLSLFFGGMKVNRHIRKGSRPDAAVPEHSISDSMTRSHAIGVNTSLSCPDPFPVQSNLLHLRSFDLSSELLSACNHYPRVLQRQTWRPEESFRAQQNLLEAFFHRMRNRCSNLILQCFLHLLFFSCCTLKDAADRVAVGSLCQGVALRLASLGR